MDINKYEPNENSKRWRPSKNLGDQLVQMVVKVVL
jgi:hypothetical protein